MTTKETFKNIKILCVEDEKELRANAVTYLKRIFNDVLEASNAFEALLIFKEERPNIIITDIKMPKMSGLEMIEKIRETDKNVQIIVLTAFTETSFLLKAVELGLIKYLIKPIRHDKFFPVLSQCAENLKEKKSNLKYITKTCIYDTFNQTLVLNKKILKLTKNEREFLTLLALNSHRVVSYEEMERTIWYDHGMSEDAIRSLVRNLRRKLPVNCLKNLSKVGYQIELI